MNDEMRRLALAGAQAEIAAKQSELDALLRMFPELGRATTMVTTPPTNTAADRPRRSHVMSPKARKAISTRMRKYWAQRRKENG